MKRPSPYQKVKILGAIEAIEDLLEHARAHLIPIDEEMIFKFLIKTKANYYNTETK